MNSDIWAMVRVCSWLHVRRAGRAVYFPSEDAVRDESVHLVAVVIVICLLLVVAATYTPSLTAYLSERINTAAR